MKDTIGWKSTGEIQPKRRFSRPGCIFIIITLLFFGSFLFTALIRAREGARRAKCLSNIKQIGLSLKRYALDNKESLPWEEDIKLYCSAFGKVTPSYCKELEIFTCPSSNERPMQRKESLDNESFSESECRKSLSYAYGHNQGKPWTEEAHSSTALAADKYAVHDYSIEPNPKHKPMNHPNTIFRSGGRHIAYLDGAAKWVWSLKMLEANPEYKALPDSNPESDQTGSDWWSDPPEKK